MGATSFGVNSPTSRNVVGMSDCRISNSLNAAQSLPTKNQYIPIQLKFFIPNDETIRNTLSGKSFGIHLRSAANSSFS